LAGRPALADQPLLEQWADREWPVIVRRRAMGEDPGIVPVGVPLPPAAGKRRIAFVLSPDGILQRSVPPLLRVAAKVADLGWQSTIDSLLALGARTGIEPLAFGSLLWEYLTGLDYLTPQSDLDVLWPVPADVDVLPLVSGIAQIQHDASFRIDGEIVFPDGSAVNWHELWNAHRSAQGSAQGSGHRAEDRITVLAKTMESVRLLDIACVPRSAVQS
jgi:phosphoribosyl-dephospho-CoA transferase